MNCTICVPHDSGYVQNRDMNFEHLEDECTVDVLGENIVVAEDHEIDCMADLGHSL
jgi:hypothetical protein